MRLRRYLIFCIVASIICSTASAQELAKKDLQVLKSRHYNTKALLLMTRQEDEKEWVLELREKNDRIERVVTAEGGKDVGTATGSKVTFEDKAPDPQSMLQGENLVENVHKRGFVFYKSKETDVGRLYVTDFDDQCGGINGDILSCLGIGSKLRFDTENWVEFFNNKYRKGGVVIKEDGATFEKGTEVLVNGQISVYDGTRWDTVKKEKSKD